MNLPACPPLARPLRAACVVACLVLAGCPARPSRTEPEPDPRAQLAGVWQIGLDSGQGTQYEVTIDSFGAVVLVSFFVGDTRVSYTGERLNARLLLNQQAVNIEFDNRLGVSGVIVDGRYRFVGNFDGPLQSAVGQSEIVGNNLGGGQIAEILGPASMARR